jgi:pilus assembly protein CpaC
MKSIICILLLSISISTMAELDPGHSYYTLEAGDVRTVTANDIERVAVGDPEVVGYKVLEEGQLLIIAQKAGNTAMQVWRKGDRISTLHFQVRESGNSLKSREIRRVLRDVPGLDISDINGRVLLEGVVSPSDAELIERVGKSSPEIINMVKVGPFDYRPLLRVDVRIVEISQRASSQLGIRWDSAAGGPIVGVSKAFKSNSQFSVMSSQEEKLRNAFAAQTGIPLPPVGDSSFYGYAGITSSLGSQIDIMAETGEARLLAMPKLVAKSGEEAKFHAGGEYPIQIIDELGRPAIEFKPYGIKLNIRPSVDDGQRISTNIYAEVSSLDFSVAIDGVPGILTRNVDSVVNVGDSDTIVISGLASSQDSNIVSKIPFLGDLPVVGGLFRSTGKSEQKTELVIMLTPRIVSPGDTRDAPLQELSNSWKDGFKSKNLDSALME